MNQRKAEIIKAVYEEENFTKAGQVLNLAQPAISRAVHELEAAYQVRLFERLPSGVKATAAGDALYQYACQLLALIGEMNAVIRNEDYFEEIKVGSTITIGNQLMSQIVNKIKIQEPDLALHIQIHNLATIQEALQENRLDMALIEAYPEDSSMIRHFLVSDQLVTIAPVQHPLVGQPSLSLESLTKEHFLLRDKGSSVRKVVEAVFSEKELAINLQWESVSTQALIRAVEAGIGISVLPYLLVKDAIKAETIAMLDVPDLAIERNYYLVYAKAKFQSKAFRRVKEIILTMFD